MFPDYSSFLSYRTSTDPNDYALLGDESRSNIAGRGTSVFIMNWRFVLVCNALNFPSLWAPLYSTQFHRTQPVILSLFYSHVRANISGVGYESMPEEHGRTHFYKWDWSQQTGKYRNMNKPQSHKNTAHIIIGSRNTTLIYDNINFNSLHGTWLYDLRTHD